MNEMFTYNDNNK